MTKLNVVFIGRISFPLGLASSKRRKYLVEYLNENNISCKVIVLRLKDYNQYNNSQHGFYGLTEYVSNSEIYYESLLGKVKYFFQVNKQLKKFYVQGMKNVLIFHTNLEIDALPFFIFARKLGYNIFFDQVETSYSLNSASMSFVSHIYSKCNDIVSNWAYKRCRGSFVISTALWKHNQEHFPKMPICLLPNATEILFKERKNKFSSPIKILYAGSFANKDGVAFLLAAFKMVLTKYSNIRLILIGKGLKKDMIPILEAIKGVNSIDYLGFVSDKDLIDNLIDADILTMTRRNSVFANFGFPFKLSEYLSTGNPVLATKVSDVEKYLVSHVNSYLAEPDSVESIYQGLCYFIENEKNAIEIGYRGYLLSKEQFSIKKIGDSFVNFITEI